MEKLVIASNNKGKIKEIAQILDGLYEVKSMSDMGLDLEVEENGLTFEANALIKAKAVFDRLGIASLSDDSGLSVDALNGAPGIFSARYCGVHGDDFGNNAKLLQMMENVYSRHAKFVSAVVLYTKYGYVTAFGETFGEILHAETGNGGFGYDPLFFSYDLQKSFGEASAEEKNLVSHRARALINLTKIIGKP